MDPGEIYFKIHLQTKQQKQFTQDVSQTSKTMGTPGKYRTTFFLLLNKCNKVNTCFAVLYDTPYQRKLGKRAT